jgi:pilus assembly protein CpaB
MKSKVLIAAVAVILGGVAALAAFVYLNGVQKAAEAGSTMTSVLVAAKDIQRGSSANDLLASGAAVLKKMPRRYVPEGAMSSLTGMVDRVLAVPVSAGEVLTSARFQYPSEAGLAFNVPPGFVAVTVPVDDARGVAGLVKPGDRVAVLITVSTKNGNGDQTGYTVPGAKVLAVGRATGTESGPQRATSGGGALGGGGTNDDKAANTITLAVSSNDAQKVVFAAESGRLWLALLPTTESVAGTATVQSMSTVLR